MKTAVDTSVLIDVFTGSAEQGAASGIALREAFYAGRLVACDVVWAEVRAHFPSAETFRDAIHPLRLQCDAVSDSAAELAGRLWREHRRRGPDGRARIVADFLIGAHAKLGADALLTRDRGFYRDYFRGLRVIDPSRGR